MSYNTDPERAAKRHPGPIIATVLALLVAAVAAFWWMGSDPADHGDVGRIESNEAPAGTAQDAPTGTPAPDTPAAGAPPQPTTPAAN